MPGLFLDLFSLDFTSQQTITVTHNANREGLFVRVFVNNVQRNDLISTVVPSATNPLNEFVVTLTSSQTGSIQVLGSDLYPVGLPISQHRPWMRRHNLTATVDPTVNNDTTQGYAAGSRWVNTTSKETFECVVPAAGAAVWNPTTTPAGAGKASPGEVIFGGTRLLYSGTGSATSNEIQYARVFLTAGLTYDRARVFVTSGDNASRHIRLGLYTQTDPGDADGVPVTRVAQTAEAGTILGYNTVSFSSPYTVSVTGYYWIAFVTDSNSVKFAITASTFPANFISTDRESTTGTTLPATASSLTNPSSAVAYVGVLEDTA